MSLPSYIVNLEELVDGVEDLVLNWDSQREGVLKSSRVILEPSSRQAQLTFNSRVSIKKIIVNIKDTYHINSFDKIKAKGAGLEFELHLLNSVNYILKDLSSESEDLTLDFFLEGDTKVELLVYYYDYEELEYLSKRVICLNTTGEIIKEYRTFVHRDDTLYIPLEILGYEPTKPSFLIEEEIVVYYVDLEKVEFFINYYIEETDPKIFIKSDRFLEDKGLFTFRIPDYVNGNFLVLGDKNFQTIVDDSTEGRIFEYFVRKEV